MGPLSVNGHYKYLILSVQGQNLTSVWDRLYTLESDV